MCKCKLKYMIFKSNLDFYRLHWGFETIILAILCFGCKTVQFEKSGANQPKALCYSLYKTIDSSKGFDSLLLQSVFINEMDVANTFESGRVDKYTGYHYLQFGFGGIAFYSSRYKIKITNEAIAQRNGQYCYYKIENEKILLELYDFHLKKFIMWQGRIGEDKIHFYSARIRGFAGGKEKINIVYYKKHVENLPTLIWPL